MPRRSLGYASLSAAVGLAVATGLVRAAGIAADAAVGTVEIQPLLVRGLTAAAVLATAVGAYLVVETAISRRLSNNRRSAHARNFLRLGFGAAAVVGIAGILTDQWVGVLASLGVIGFAVTFALQQPILSLVAWFYSRSRPSASGLAPEGEAHGRIYRTT